MKLIIDADNLIYASAVKHDTISDALDSFKEKIIYILNALSDDVSVSGVMLCHGSKNCFRHAVNSSYKLNRKKEKPELLFGLHKAIREEYNSFWGDGVETDDVVATLWKGEVDLNGLDSAIIVSADKDFKQFPCWFFNSHYKRMELSKISDFDAKVNFYTQMIVGDSADNINYCKGYGIAYVEKLFKNVDSEFGLFRKTYYLYLEIYKEEAKSKFKECYKMLKLITDGHEFIKRGH